MEENIDLRPNLSQDELVRISPLTLAYLGDTVYESYIIETTKKIPVPKMQV